MIQAFVGSGGKTGTILARAQEYRAQGKRVLVTTSTHIGARPEAIVGDDADAIIRALRETGYALAGRYAGEHKIGALSEKTYLAACEEADVVLVEADGSRQLPLKFPAAHEPVIPENAEEIVVIAGMSALGRPAREVCHRLELVKACLGIEDGAMIKPEHIERLILEGYVKPLRARYTEKNVTILPRQCDTLCKRAVGALLREEKPVSLIRPEWFAPRQRLVVCGAGHVAQALAGMAAQLDFDVTVFDDRAEFACAERFAGAERIVCDGFEHLHRVLSPGAYYVAATRGHAQDYACVRTILRGDFAYLGMLGSKRKVQMVTQRLRADGVPQEKIDEIHMPIGLPIGAQTPAEIAVSILAEIIQLRHARGEAALPREMLESRACGMLCVITEKNGSAPRGVGSMMLITEEGTIGSIGGGAMERLVIEDAARTETVTERTYDGEKTGMVCGGQNRVLFIPLPEEEKYIDPHENA